METKIYISDKLAEKWREYAMKRFGFGKGSISKAAEEALAFWTTREEKITRMLVDMKSICETDSRIIALMLFGSYARKEVYRDIDIAVIVNENEVHTSHLDILSRIEASAPEGIEIDVSIFNALSLEIRSRILSEGRVVYVRDTAALYDVSIEVVRQFGDLKPLIDRVMVS